MHVLDHEAVWLAMAMAMDSEEQPEPRDRERQSHMHATARYPERVERRRRAMDVSIRRGRAEASSSSKFELESEFEFDRYLLHTYPNWSSSCSCISQPERRGYVCRMPVAATRTYEPGITLSPSRHLLCLLSSQILELESWISVLVHPATVMGSFAPREARSSRACRNAYSTYVQSANRSIELKILRTRR